MSAGKRTHQFSQRGVVETALGTVAGIAVGNWIDIDINIDIDIDLSSFVVCMFGFQIIPLDLEGMQISKPLGQRLGQESFGFS